MRRSVTTVRACVHAFALLIALLLAAQGASTLAPPGSERTSSAAAQATGLSAPGEVEHETAQQEARRTVRAPTGPPNPGERPHHAACRRAHSLAAGHPCTLPATGSAGIPWSRSVEVPVLHQVFRH